MNLVINGAEGKMGKALLASVQSYPDINVVGKIGRYGGLSDCIEQADVIVDFSFHESTVTLAEACANYRKPMVIGTTALTVEDLRRITEASIKIPIVKASNFSTGMNILFFLAEKAAKGLGLGFDVEVVEFHHRRKRDAPSGTANTLVGILANVIENHFDVSEATVRYGRGSSGERTKSEIGVHAIRGGDVVGEHTVIFAGDGERLELTHKASSRDAFARGALRAALWVVQQSPGLYNMHHVLEL